MVLGLASLQGFVLSAIIFFNGKGLQIANRVLGILLFIFSLGSD